MTKWRTASELVRKSKEKYDRLRVKFVSQNPVKSILENANELSTLSNWKVYIKPDKSKAENAEYQRLGKRKVELLAQYSAEGDGQPRVVLAKGILTVDGVEIDRYKPIQSLF